MNMTAYSLRKNILADLGALIDGTFGPAGTGEAWFRNVRVGAIMPSAFYPVCIVTDGGQRKAGEDADSTDAYELDLSVQVTLMLAEDWTRVANMQMWTERVEAIVAMINRHLPVRGVLRMDYLEDDPADVVFFSGASAAVWQIQFECRRFEPAFNLPVEEGGEE